MAARRRRGCDRPAPRPMVVAGCGTLAAAAADGPWFAQGHQDHHRGPAPRDMEEESEAMLSLSAERLLLNKKFSELQLLTNAGMASKSLDIPISLLLSVEINASLALRNIIKIKETN